MTNTQNEFTRTLRNLEGMLARRDSGSLTGRNDSASQDGMRRHARRLHNMILDHEDVGAMLDANPRMAARYDRAERRVYGMPV